MLVRDGFWLGTPGLLVPLPDVKDSLSMSGERSVTFRTTVGGRRTAHLGPTPKRDWSVSLSGLTPSQLSQVQVVLATVLPPYVWITPWAARVNVLTPAQSLLQGVPGTNGGLRQIVGGAWVPSLLSPTTILATGVPVSPGMTVTGACHARATSTSATVSVEWISAAGVTVSGPHAASKAVSATGQMERVSVTAIAPDGAATLKLRASGASVIAAPSVTYTSEALEWGIGSGAVSVVASDPQFTPSVISESARGSRAGGITFNVYEVG